MKKLGVDRLKAADTRFLLNERWNLVSDTEFLSNERESQVKARRFTGALSFIIF